MIDPEIYRAARLVEARTRRAMVGRWSGFERSIFKGRGLAFEEVRAYQPGDDVHDIDWKVTARTGEPFVKIFAEERERIFWLLVDRSGSMDFGSTGQTKLRSATEAAAFFAIVGAVHNDRVGMITFAGDDQATAPAGKMKIVLPSRGRRHALRLIRDLLLEPEPESAVTSNAAIQTLRRCARQRSVVFVVSDFLWDDAASRLEVLAHRHHVFALHVVDPFERRLPDAGLIRWRDSESARELLIDSGSKRYRTRYEQAARLREEELHRAFSRRGIDWISISTHRSAAHTLIEYFRK